MDSTFIGDRIAYLRNIKKVSARDMSLSLGQSVNYINSIENHYVFPSMPIFLYICEYLNVTPKEFFDIENPNPNAINKILSSLKSLDKEQLEKLASFIDSLNINGN